MVYSRKYVLFFVKLVGKFFLGDEIVGWNFVCCFMLVIVVINLGLIRFFFLCILLNWKVGLGYVLFWLLMILYM